LPLSDQFRYLVNALIWSMLFCGGWRAECLGYIRGNTYGDNTSSFIAYWKRIELNIAGNKRGAQSRHTN
jgi:hypothetical protein